jgi:3-oxoadipate enol-lactonase
MPFAEHDDARIYFEVHGDGPALVLAHGAGGNRLSWWQQVPVFAQRYRVVTFDHRGFGRSRCQAFRPHAFVADLEAVLAAAEVERVSIVSQSMGGWTGLPFALRHPERVRCLVLACTPGGYVDDAVLASVAEMAKRIEQAGIDHTPALGASFARRRPDMRHLYDQIGALNTEMDLSGAARIFDRESRLAPNAERSLSTPLLMLTGSEDLLFPPSLMRAVARVLPGAEIQEVEGAGHSIYFEKPELFNQVVGAFLERHADA